MKIRSFFTVIGILGMLTSVTAQNATLQAKYKSGKQLYNQQRYEEAIEVLRPLTTYQNSFAKYATFYYALAADRSGQKEIGKNLLLQLIRKYPNWDKLDDAYYWLGKLYFDKSNPDEALGYLNKIKTKKVRVDANALESHGLSEIPELEVLLQLHKKYSQDAVLGEALAIKIAQQPMAYRDTELLASLVDQYKLDPNNIGQVQVGESEMKPSYNVGVLFPFMMSGISNQQNKNPNQWVLDLYEGIRIGQKRLQKDGINLNLYSYDTKRDSARTSQILAEEEFKSMDLIIGPLYPAPSQLASGFSLSQQINIVNPLSGNSQIIEGNPFSFLFRPCYETEAMKAADFASEHFKDKNAIVLYGSRAKDSVMAFAYQQALESASFKTVILDKISTRDSEEVSKSITQQIHEALNSPGNSNISHIMVASSEEIIVANVVNTIHNLNANISIVGHEDWLQFRYLDYEQLERLDVYLIAPAFMDYESENLKEFRENYVSATNSLPNKYAYSGYDLMMFFGRMLNQHGTLFQNGFAGNEFVGGELFPGYNYQEANDNQHVPIVTFDKGALKQTN